MTKKKTKRAKPYTFFIILVLITISLLLSLFWIYKNYFRVTWEQTSLTETSVALSNPYCGWYQIYGYTLSDDSAYSADAILESCKSDSDTRLALLEINLKNFNTGSVSNYAIQQLDTLLSVWEQTNKKLILRFLYDWDGVALTTEPNDISIILEHMSQIGAVLNKHVDAIYTLQGIFVGDVGEMHNSNYMSEESMHLLINQLAKVTDPSIFLSVRTPALWRQISSSFHPLTPVDAFSNTLSARIGLFNDGMLGSEYDCGTYGDSPLSSISKYSDKGCRVDELNFQNQLCQFVPNGGEVIIDNPFNDLNAAIKDLSIMHVSYLNNMYDANVFDKWKSTTYLGSDSFHGHSGYDYIGNHLGYRYVLRSTALTFQTFKDKSASFSIDIDNIGFANSYKEFDVTLFIKNRSTQVTMELPVNTDTRNWFSNMITQIVVPLNVRSYGIGDYEIYLSVTDPNSKEQIRFANTNFNSSLGYFLGSFTTKKST